jgi:hypothetical protein
LSNRVCARREKLISSKTQVQFANEGAEKKKHEEEVAARKRKMEDKEKWEGESYYPFFPTVDP